MAQHELYYVFAMGSEKRKAAKVFTETESKKLKNQVVCCGATYYLKARCYGLIYCKPADYEHWMEWAKKRGGRIIEWEHYKRDDGVTCSYLYSPNRKQIAYTFRNDSDKSPSEM